MARQALIVCLAERPTHAEALNNLGVLELRRGDTADSTDVTSNWGDRGRANIQMSRQIDPTIFETIYNTGKNTIYMPISCYPSKLYVE